jgi:Fe-S-cluster containining protein
MIWECTGCGKCCEDVKNIVPNFALKDGTCCHLDVDTRQCKIYFERPLVCRVDEHYETNLKYFMDKDRYYTQQQIMCELVKEK